MKNRIITLVAVAILASSFAIPFGVGAAFTPPSTVKSLPPPPISSTNDVEGLVRLALLWLFWGLMVLGVVMFLVGGYKYATAAGEPEKVGDANKILRYAAIAIVVGLIAAGVPYLIASFFGNNLLQTIL